GLLWLQRLGPGMGWLALGVDLLELRGIEQVTARLEPRGDSGQIVAQQLNIEHDVILPEAQARSMARAHCADATVTRRLFWCEPSCRARAAPRASRQFSPRARARWARRTRCPACPPEGSARRRHMRPVHHA